MCTHQTAPTPLASHCVVAATQANHHRIADSEDPGLGKEAAHSLEQTSTATRVTATGRAIPAELWDLGYKLATVCNPVQIHEGLQQEAKRLGLDHTTWDYKDVYDKFPVDVSRDNDFDAAGLIEKLEQDSREKGLNYKATVDATRHLNKLFVEV